MRINLLKGMPVPVPGADEAVAALVAGIVGEMVRRHEAYWVEQGTVCPRRSDG